MADSSLQDRLRDHAKAFNGLLSLIPAKMYYGEDHSDQWKKEKQTKQEAAAARRAKLDPDSALNRNAKEVLDERAENKRKLRQAEHRGQEESEDQAEAEAYEPVDGVEAEKPREGLKLQGTNTTPSKQRQQPGLRDHDGESNDDVEMEDQTQETTGEPKLSRKEEKRAAKREKKAEKRAEKRAEKKAKVVTGETQPDATKPDSTVEAQEGEETRQSQGDAQEDGATVDFKKQKKTKKTAQDSSPTKRTAISPKKGRGEEQGSAVVSPDIHMEDGEQVSAGALNPSPVLSTLADEGEGEGDKGESAAESEPSSPTFDTNTTMSTNLEALQSAEAASTSTSTSISSTAAASERPKPIKIPADTTALRARLAAKIEALRAARKADGPDGKPIRTRQELIESRRIKEAQRKEHKKELRQLAKLEESRKREEALASNSPGVMSPSVASLDQGDKDSKGALSFGRVSFADGTQLSHDLSYFLSRDRKKGPSDAKTALLKVQNQKKRLEELDEGKRKEVADKEAWLTARRRVEGDKIRDDEGMLKKAVKRKEAAKKKSDKAWRERASGVAQAQKERQRKREENIAQRREDKLLRRSGKKKKGGAGKKKGRPGFEGSLGVRK